VVDELVLVHVLLGAVALISCLSVDNKRTIRTMPRALWVVAILLVPVAGPIVWFLAGRPYTLTHRPGWRLPRRRFDPRPPPAPDDDTDFLQSLDQITGDSEPGRTDPPGAGSQEGDQGPDQHDPGRQE
jgi:hypothetical protein